MKKFLYIFLAVVAIALAFGWYYVEKLPQTNKQNFSSESADVSNSPYQELVKGKVSEVVNTDVQTDPHLSRITQDLKVVLQSGSEKNVEVEVNYDEPLVNAKVQEVKKGDTIVVGKIASDQGGAMSINYVMVDRYRLLVLLYGGLIFLALAIIFARLRGLTSLVGLAVSVFVLISFITPNILDGKNPALVTLVGAGVIALISMFFAHGFNKRATLAVTSTLIALGISEAIGHWFIIAAKLLGNGSEQAFYIQTGFFGAINLQGLLLGGIIIATLGILNDVTIAQSATIEELHTANPQLSFKQLFAKGSSVGREHIASLINTLVLVYVGASLPLFLLFTVNSQQLCTVLNSSTIAEEIIRTLIGSMALIIAVPIATALSSYYFKSESKLETSS